MVRSRPEDATLSDVIIDGFEKNEIINGFHWRQLPLPDEAVAVRKFGELVEEARRWKGAPARHGEDRGRRLAAWPDLEIRQVGRAILVRVRMSRFRDWWYEDDVWSDRPFDAMYDWLEEERDASAPSGSR